ncbi:MAG: murein hydrolase activator EnvC family protein [Chakrabartia sp.]
MSVGLSGAVAGQNLGAHTSALGQLRADAQRAARLADMLEARAQREADAAGSAERAAAALATRIQASEARLSAAEARLLLLQRMTELVRARLAERQRPAARLIGALQMLGRRPPALALIQPGTSRDLVHSRMLVVALLPHIQRRTADLSADLVTRRQLEAGAARTRSQMAEGRAALRNQHQALIRLQISHRAAASRFADSALAEEDRAVALGERARDLVDLIDQLGVQSARQSDLAQLPGPMMRPAVPGRIGAPAWAPSTAPRRVPGYRLPVSGRLVAGFGELSRSGARSRGLTFETRDQALLVAPRAGRIVYAGPFRGYGQIIILDHGTGWTSLLTGLASLKVRVGEAVAEGAPLGRAGQGPARVMVELRQGSRPVDILQFVS